MPPVADSPRILPTRGRYFCPVALPWFSFMRRRTPAAWLRRAAYPCMPPRSRFRQLTWLRYLLHWPLLSLLASLRAVRRWGRAVEALSGMPRRRQLFAVWRTSLLDNIPPHDWYLFRMWTESGQAIGHDLLCGFEAQPLLRWINRASDARLLADKRRFHAACRLLGLPVVGHVLELQPDGREDWHCPEPELPAHDLFIKRPDGMCGRDAELWEHDPAASGWRRDGALLDEAGLLAHLRAQARDGGRIVQTRLRNHAALDGLSERALCTLRIVTWRWPGEAARTFSAVLRMPLGDAVIDNFTPGGVCAEVTPEGVLGNAATPFVAEWVDHHPRSGAMIRGRELPDFAAACALACRAQDGLGFDGIVGWDIALTPDGPVLVEGNPTWSTDLMQVAAGRALGAGQLPEIVRGFVEGRD